LENEYCLHTWQTTGKEDAFSLKQEIEGHWLPPYKSIKIFLVGFPTYVRKCQVDNSEMPIKEIRLRDRALYTVSVPPDFKRITWNA
jgi:hypothetical protein